MSFENYELYLYKYLTNYEKIFWCLKISKINEQCLDKKSVLMSTNSKK